MAESPGRPARQLIKRHSVVVRITHWINVVCLTGLLMSGLQIFNAHPALYWDQDAASIARLYIAALGRQPDGAGLQVGKTLTKRR
jgi:Ni,Fe-hydrogenase I cytochrome b subunit